MFTHHDARTKYILSFRSQEGADHTTFHIMSPRWMTVEEALRYSEERGNDLDQSEVIQRVTLNFGLLMTNFGVRVRGPVDPASHAKRTRNAPRQNRRKADRAWRLLDTEINLIEFEQDWSSTTARTLHALIRKATAAPDDRTGGGDTSVVSAAVAVDPPES